MNWNVCYSQLSNQSHWHIYFKIIALSLIRESVKMLRTVLIEHEQQWLASFRRKDKYNAAGFPQLNTISLSSSSL